MAEDSMTESNLAPNRMRRFDFRGQMLEATPVAFVTPLLVALNALVFLAMVFRGVPFLRPTAHDVIPWGANFGPLTETGQWWRLLAACFIHFGIVHIAVNMYVLLQVGSFTERLFGNLRYAVLYLLAGIGGNVAGLFFHPYAVGAGASGAIFGVFGGLLGFLLTQRGVVPRRAASGIATSAGIFVLYNLIYGVVRPETDQVAHIAGIIIGFLAGCALARPLAPAARHLGWLRAVVTSGAAAILMMVAIRYLPRRDPAQSEWYTRVVTAPVVTLRHNDRVAYIGRATQADAQRVAEALTKDGLFRPADVMVLLERNASGAILSIPIQSEAKKKEPWTDPVILASFRSMGPLLATAAGGPPLTVRLLSQDGIPKAQVEIRTGEVAVGQRDHVLYSGAVQAAQAAALGVALERAGFFVDRGAAVIANRKDAKSVPELGFVVTADAPQTAAFMDAIAQVALRVAGTLGGPPLLVRVVNADGEVRSEQMVR